MKFDGLTNIWLNINDLYPSDKIMILNHLKCVKGYCFLSRSKTYKNVPIEYCINLEHTKITNDKLHLINKNEIILCKMPSWKIYIPAKILTINDKINYGCEEFWSFGSFGSFGNGTLDLYFPTCPDSDVYLTWHNGNNILCEKSMLTYKNILAPEMKRNKSYNNIAPIEPNNIVLDIAPNNIVLDIAPIVLDIAPIAPIVLDIAPNNIAPFCLNNEEINNFMEDIVEKVIENLKPIVHSGIFEKKDNVKSELLRYKLAWLTSNKNNEVNISKKPVNVAYNNINDKFLSNVSVISSIHFNEIMKIQCKNNLGLKIVSNNEIYKDKLEPQNHKFFNKLPKSVFCFDTYTYTYTGKLCVQAKNYLFNTNKIEIK